MDFKIGMKVKVVKYGHLIWSSDKIAGAKLIKEEPAGMYWYDIYPDLVGQKGVIVKISGKQYAIKGPYKYAWYDKQQLKKVLFASKSKIIRRNDISEKKINRVGRTIIPFSVRSFIGIFKQAIQL